MDLLRLKRPVFQLLPLFRGKLRLSRFFYKQGLKKPSVFRIRYGLTLKVPSLVDSIGYELFINGVYEAKTIRYLVKTIPKGGVLVDVGANIGAIAIVTARLRPDVQVYAFEASPFIFSFLKENIEQNRLANVFAYNKAVHETNDAELSFYAPEDEFGKGSFSQTYSNKPELVKTVRLDHFLAAHHLIPSVVKVDVQGYEYYVFKGMRDYYAQQKPKPIILFEFESWAEKIAMGEEGIGIAKQCVIDYGYQIVAVGAGVQTGKEMQDSELVALPL
jgi:FkbM family methyltransferase